MAYRNSCNYDHPEFTSNSSYQKLKTLNEVTEEEECDCGGERNTRVEPGKGLLAYLNRLSTFCKKTSENGSFANEELKEFPKSVTVSPEKKPEDHKLSFVDDIPYVATMKPYLPKFLNCCDDNRDSEDDEDKPDPWIETCTSQNCTPNCCNCGLQSYNLKRRCKIFSCTREALIAERFKCEDYGAMNFAPRYEYTFVRSELPSWIKKEKRSS